MPGSAKSIVEADEAVDAKTKETQEHSGTKEYRQIENKS